MQISTIKFSQIEDRIDAEYYKPEYLEVKEKLDKSKGIKFLGDIVNVIMNGVEFRTYSLSGKPYLRVSDIKEVFMDLSDVKYIPENIEFSKNIELLGGDVLTSRSGTLGISAIAPKAGSVISSHLIRISPKKEINSYYLVVFLNSRCGRLQILQKNNGAVVPEINQPSLKSLKIPIPPQSFQQKIEKMVKEAQGKMRSADEKYIEAEEVLNKELGLEDLDLSTQKTFEAKFSEAEDRFDSRYYQPKYKKIIHLLKAGQRKNEFTLYDLDNILTVKRGSLIDDGYYCSTGIPYIRIKDLTYQGVDPTDFAYINEYQAKVGGYEIVKEGDQLLTVIGATVGKLCRAPKELDGSFFSNNISRLRLKKEFLNKIDTIYLETALRSPICQSQILRNATQTAQPKLNDAEVRNMSIPILLQPIQQKISSLIQESFQLRQEAKELINRAKQKVEELIEK